MYQYQDLLYQALTEGHLKGDRTGTGTRSIFGHQSRYDLSLGFPLVTTKKMYTKAIIHELLWFLSGSQNTKYLTENGIKIWNEWSDENGHLGPVYGYQWRSWPSKSGESIDQISQVISQIKNNPNSRRLIVSAWNVSDIDKMALPPCHCLFQFYVSDDGRLSCQLYQRSADLFLGVPFNIASYSLLTMMVAKVCDLEMGEFIHTIGDAHIYVDHLDQVELQLTRIPEELPSMEFEKRESIFSYGYEDFSLQDYVYHPPIKAKISV